jgi:hypothetical protein
VIGLDLRRGEARAVVEAGDQDVLGLAVVGGRSLLRLLRGRAAQRIDLQLLQPKATRMTSDINVART